MLRPDPRSGLKRVNDADFSFAYTPLRMSQTPEVAVSVIANGEHATGVGEPAVTVIAPAFANAIFNASGARIRSLPITAEVVEAALKA
jgi:isoquinoline 1-oxidoreductase subunit beta